MLAWCAYARVKLSYYYLMDKLKLTVCRWKRYKTSLNGAKKTFWKKILIFTTIYVKILVYTYVKCFMRFSKPAFNYCPKYAIMLLQLQRRI